MPVYKCYKCSYTTNKKQHINKHLAKLNPCKTEVIICQNVMSSMNDFKEEVPDFIELEEFNM